MLACIAVTASGAPIPVTRIARSWKRRGSALSRIALGSESACRPKRNGRKPRAAPTRASIPGATSCRTELALISMQAGMIFATSAVFARREPLRSLGHGWQRLGMGKQRVSAVSVRRGRRPRRLDTGAGARHKGRRPRFARGRIDDDASGSAGIAQLSLGAS